MFTGIIQRLGSVKSVSMNTLKVDTGIADISSGESISVNGVCLTVSTVYGKGLVRFDVSSETINRTSIGRLKSGERVNIERALKPESFMGGHIVTGHVDGVSRLEERNPSGDSITMQFSCPEGLERYIVYKGSVALDGISLTVAAVSRDRFSVVIVPYTMNNTVFRDKKVGDIVNLETDILARYADRLISAFPAGVTMKRLREAGF